MTWLSFLNAFVFQWFFVRLARVFEDETDRQIGWTWLVGILPLTGWWSDYLQLRWKRN